MKPDDFRMMALGLPHTVERAHHQHPDFRVKGKIFATLGYPNEEWGVVCLTPAEQARFSKREPDVFVPVKGAWGRAGNTQVYLQSARQQSVRDALEAAWKNHAPKERKIARPTPAASSRSPNSSSRTPNSSSRTRNASSQSRVASSRTRIGKSRANAATSRTETARSLRQTAKSPTQRARSRTRRTRRR